MQNGSEEGFQIGTLVVATISALVVIFYLLIFLNPRIAFNPFKPPLPSPTLIAIAAALPPTWTPTATLTDTPTPTMTPTSTSTPTLVPSPTSPPTHTPTVVTRTPTRVVPSPTSVAPTPIPSRYSYRADFRCEHSGGTYIKGTVSSGGQPQEGVRVRVANGPDVATFVEEQFTRRQPDGSATFAFVLRAIGAFEAPAAWYVWIVDGTGSPLSDPNFHFQTNNYPPDNPAACWLAVVDFVR